MKQGANVGINAMIRKSIFTVAATLMTLGAFSGTVATMNAGNAGHHRIA